MKTLHLMFITILLACTAMVASAETITATFNAATDVPVTASSYTATGNTVTFTLNYAPTTGEQLMVVNNTGLGFISGTFTGLAQGQGVTLSFGGVNYCFVANYYGGTGNDLVLHWANARPVAWGWNLNGQLGNNSTTNSSVPLAVNSTGVLAGKTVIAMTAGGSHSLALCSDGTLAAWGLNSHGQLGNNSTTDSHVPVAVNRSGVLAGKTVVALAAGDAHSLALCSDGKLVAWGYNDDGELGNNSTIESHVPVAVSTAGVLAGKTVIAVSAGAVHSVALCSDGTLAAWGDNPNGQLGNNSGLDSRVPVAVSRAGVLSGKSVIAVASGGFYSLALCTDGTLAAWGDNNRGQLGNNNTTSSSVPVAVSAGGALSAKTVIAVSAGYAHNLALCSDGTLAAWGNNENGQLGDGTTVTNSPYGKLVPVAVSSVGVLSGKTITSAFAGSVHSLALCSDGTLAAWGYNAFGQLGNNSTTQSNVPVAVDAASLAVGERVVAETSHPYAHHTLGIVASPMSDVATLSNLTLSNGTLTPAFASGTKNYTASVTSGTISVKPTVTQATVKVNDTTVGSSSYSGPISLNLGENTITVVVTAQDGTTTQTYTVIVTRIAVAHIAIEQPSGTLLVGSGTVITWGSNGSNGYFGETNVPVGLTGVVAVAAGWYHTVALKSDGTVIAWGKNDSGQTSVPSGLTGVKAIAAGNFHTVALKSDGTVVGWGTPNSGTSVPSGLTGVQAIAAGYGHTVVLRSDGTVAAWSLTGNGDGEATVPVGLSNVTAIAAGWKHSVALKSDGTVVAWGLNGNGQTSVPGGLTGVQAIAAGGLHTLALKHDGTVITWGDNYFGQSSVPSGLAGVRSIAAGWIHSMAVKGDGTVVAWGMNDNLQTSVPVGLTGVQSVSGGVYHSVALVRGTPVAPFGNPNSGAPGTPVTFTVRNTGMADLTLGAITKDGANPGDFAVSAPAGTIIAPGGTTTFTVTFTPGAAGPRSATLHVPSNDTDKPSFDIVLSDTNSSFLPGTLALGSSAIRVNEETGVVNIPVVRTNGSYGAVSVMVSTVNGTAKAPGDFTALNNVVVNFASGETFKTVPVPIIADVLNEPHETFTVNLASPSGGATLGSVTTATVRILEPDTTNPMLTVTAPATATTVSAPSPYTYTVKGVASDDKGIDRVEVALNGGTPVFATLSAVQASLSAPYSLNVQPPEGTSTFVVTAFDLRGNSTSVTRTFTFIRRYVLTLTRVVPSAVSTTPDSAGTVTIKASPTADASALAPTTANANPKTSKVVPGTAMTVTAAAKAGYVFSHWSTVPAGAVAAGNVLTFAMPAADVAATAAFVVNPNGGPAGSGTGFYGLIRPTVGATRNVETEGYLTGTITATSGAFTGKVFMGGTSQAFSAIAYGNGSVLFKVGTSLVPTLAFGTRTLSLAYNAGAGNDQMAVTLANSADGSTCTGIARRGIYSAGNLVDAALLNAGSTKGIYTVVFPAEVQNPVKDKASYPQGDGYATITLTNTGAVSLAGVLADGTAVSAASALVSGNACPIFAQMITPGQPNTVKGGVFLGTVIFDATLANTDVSGTDLVWIRPDVNGLATTGTAAANAAADLYTVGWPNGITVDAVGALYDKTVDVPTALGLGAADAVIGNGKLAFADGKLTGLVEVTQFNAEPGSTAGTSKVTKIPATNSEFTLTLTQSSGIMSGTFTPVWKAPLALATAKPAFKGIIIQKGANKGGYGFFISNAPGDADPESGGVTLSTPSASHLNVAFMRIEGGAFEMGHALDDLGAVPLHTVSVSTCYIQATETSKGQWDAVRTWGLANGYTDLPTGANRPSAYPVQGLSWYAVVKWCNARSEMEGLTPCYYTDAAHTTAYRTGDVNLSNTMVDWVADGYRLPTEAEWEKAARGGLAGKRFPWGDTIKQLQANYYSSRTFSYDVNPVAGYHPVVVPFVATYSCPVGLFAANGYGLRDMAGNVGEWCWDWYDSVSIAPSTDPRGPVSGNVRIVRGGSGSEAAVVCCCAYRMILPPSLNSWPDTGFRTVRTSP